MKCLQSILQFRNIIKFVFFLINKGFFSISTFVSLKKKDKRTLVDQLRGNILKSANFKNYAWHA